MLYRARVITPYSNGSCQVLIPQVYGDVPVLVTRFVVDLPMSAGFGWVTFEGGSFSHPVWLSLDPSIPIPGIASLWYTGTASPSAELGSLGDWYLLSTTGAVYEKVDQSTWTFRMNITGPQGPIGQTGAVGPQGPTGKTSPATNLLKRGYR